MDLSAIPDDQLKALYSQSQSGAAPQAPDLSSMSDDELKALYQQSKPAQEPVNPVADVAKAAGSGLVKGGASILGAPGDIQDFAGWVAGKLGALGVPPEKIAEIQARAANPLGLGHAATTEGVLSGINKVTGFTPYEPQTPVGKVAGAVGEFIPGALVGGPAKEGVSMLANAGKNVLKYAVAPGVTSEVAGQVADKVAPELAPAARFAGALVGGTGAAARDVMAERRAATATIPSTEELRQKAQDLYLQSEQNGLRLAPQPYQNAVNRITSEVRSAGIDPGVHPKASSALERLKASANGQPIDLKELDTVRQVLGQAAKANEPSERFMAGKMISGLDRYVNNLKLGDIQSVTGNAKDAIGNLREARVLWRTQAKSQVLEDVLQKAETRVETQPTLGVEGAIRGEFRNLAMNPKRMQQFSSDERKAIHQVAAGSGIVENALRLVGKFKPTGVVSAVLGHILAGGNPVTTAGLYAGGALAKGGAGALARDAANRAIATVHSGGVTPQPLARSASSAILRRAGRAAVISGEGQRAGSVATGTPATGR